MSSNTSQPLNDNSQVMTHAHAKLYKKTTLTLNRLLSKCQNDQKKKLINLFVIFFKNSLIHICWKKRCHYNITNFYHLRKKLIELFLCREILSNIFATILEKIDHSFSIISSFLTICVYISTVDTGK